MDKAKQFLKDHGMLAEDDDAGGKDTKGKKGGKGPHEKKAKDNTIDVATITAIKGIQKVLADMGYTLTAEIKRADLFKAQRDALKAIDLEQRARALQPFTSLYDQFMKLRDYNATKTGGDNNVTINLSNVDENTRVKDLINLAKKR